MFSSLYTFGKTQDARAILLKAGEKCNAIQNGSYEMTTWMKFATESGDTSVADISCRFVRADTDTNFHSYFNSRLSIKNQVATEMIYDGKALVKLNLKDSSALFYSPNKYWNSIVNDTRKRYPLYRPFTYREKSHLPVDSTLKDKRNTLRYMGVEKINGENCHRILFQEYQVQDTNPKELNVIKVEFEYWISKKANLPIQYSQTIVIVMSKDTMTQYQAYRINKYTLNLPDMEPLIDINSVPRHYRIIDFNPTAKKKETLATGSEAPLWTLASLDNDSVSLNDLKGQLVLVDFFHKSCYPCLLAFPALQDLHEKYASKGLKVVGIDPYDKEADVLKSFLEKRDVTYTILLSDAIVPENYKVAGYPTLFLLDRTGKVILVQAGYSKEIDAMLEKLILENL